MPRNQENTARKPGQKKDYYKLPRAKQAIFTVGKSFQYTAKGMMMPDPTEYSVSNNSTLLQAMQKMDECRRKLLILLDDDGRYLNLLSIGDIQRALVAGRDLNATVNSIKIEPKLVANDSDNSADIKDLMLRLRLEFMPVINKEKRIVKIIDWSDYFSKRVSPRRQISIPVVIMAGGQGTRLRPMSSVFPKPLMPLGDHTILEEIINRFSEQGCTDFFLTLNYKSDLIEHYIETTPSLKSKEIKYILEREPLGTAGSLAYLRGKIHERFFVSNCDIVLDQDMSEVCNFHEAGNYDITLVSAYKHIRIDYGTLTTSPRGELLSMVEKPSLNMQLNTGVYLLEPHLLSLIPEGTHMHLTDLIHTARSKGYKAGVFPITEHSWYDIGEWQEYVKTVKRLYPEGNFNGL